MILLSSITSRFSIAGSLDLRPFHACKRQSRMVVPALLVLCWERRMDFQDLEQSYSPAGFDWMDCLHLVEIVRRRRMKLASCCLSACSSRPGYSEKEAKSKREKRKLKSRAWRSERNKLTKEVSLIELGAIGSQAFCSSNVGSAHGCKSPDANIP